jgi:signal transduction histidine kinase
VDDNRDLAENICEILESLDGVEVQAQIAGDARSARELSHEMGSELDLAIVDLRLPDADGIAVTAQLRESCAFAEVVIITGDATIEAAIAAVDRGAFAFVLKPFRGAELLRAASSALGKVNLARERERLRAELESSERRHREVVDAVPAFVLALDQHGRIQVWNRRLEEVSGFAREEMLGQLGLDLVDGGSDRKLPLKSGGHRLVRWQYADLSRPVEGRMQYALGTDVTEERAMYRRTLRAERLAAVGTLAAGLAHEVRNPLNSALLQLQVLKRRSERGAGPDALLPVLAIVEDEIRRLERLVHDFLSFAQPAPMQFVSADVNALARSVVGLIAPEAEAQRVAIVTRLDPAVGVVEAAPEQLRQILLNLTRNAIEAMADGGQLGLFTESADSAGEVTITIEDNGPGFPEDAPVFDAFYTTKPSGTGLGLAIVHRIVSEHAGSIAVESKPGRTRFTIKLPQHSLGSGIAPRA